MNPPACPPPKNPRISLGYFTTLPDDIIVEGILTKLSPKDLDNLSLTCQMMYVFSRDDDLWKPFALKKNLLFLSNWRFTLTKVETTRLEFDGTFSQHLYSKWCRRHMNVETFLPVLETIDTVPYKQLSRKRFELEYEVQHTPVLMKQFTNQRLNLMDLKEYEKTWFKVLNEDSNPKVLKMTLGDYIRYMETNTDETPLYIFDECFDDKIKVDYKVPDVFDQDLLQGLEKRPPWKWMVIGPQRSGASWHVDPLGTSAWNTLYHGQKRWALYPPHFEPPGYGMSSLEWYLEIYPYLNEDLKPLEVLQSPGDTLFVPSGWWHLVLNLSDTIAITQNFMSKANAHHVIPELLKKGYALPKMYSKFDLSLYKQRAIDLQHPIPVSSVSNPVFVGETSFCKFYLDPLMMQTEYQVLKALSTQPGQWFPRIIDVGKDYIIMSKLETVGDFNLNHLKTLHSLSTTGTRFVDFLQKRLSQTKTYPYLTDTLRAKIPELLSTFDPTTVPQTSLLHGDLNPGNVLGQGLIDFGDALIEGDPLWDLLCYYLTCSQTPAEFYQLLREYTIEWNQATQDRAIIYLLLWPFENVLKCASQIVFEEYKEDGDWEWFKSRLFPTHQIP